MCTHTLSQVLRPRRNLLLKGFWLGVCNVEPVTSRLPWAGLWAGAARWNLRSSHVSNWELPIPFLFQVRGASVSCCSGGSLSCPGPCGLSHHLCVLRREEKGVPPPPPPLLLSRRRAPTAAAHIWRHWNDPG